MKTYGMVTASFAVFALLGLLSGPTAGQEKAMTVKAVMGKLNKGPNSLTPTLAKELKDDEPDWDTIQKEAKEFVALTENIGKNEPSKGSKESWEKLCKAYVDNAQALEKAAENKDKKAAQAALAKMSQQSFCKGCHTAHRN